MTKLDAGLGLIRRGEFFAAHEELEDAWRAAEPAERDVDDRRIEDRHDCPEHNHPGDDLDPSAQPVVGSAVDLIRGRVCGRC